MKSQKKLGVVLSYTAQGVHVLTNLIYVPVMLRILGQSEYGLYQLASATISNLNILTLGFNSAYIRFFSRYKTKDDQKGIARLNGMFLTIFLLLAIVCILCGMVIVANADFVFGEGLSLEELDRSRLLMAILVFSLAVTFITSVFQSQVSAYEKFAWLKGIDLVGFILNPCIALPLLIMGYGSVAVVAVTLGVNVFVCVANLLYTLCKLRIKYDFEGFDLNLLREMSGFTFYVFLNIVVEQINWTIDKYLLGRMKGTGAVAIYSVGAQIVTIYRNISGTIRGVFVPQINKMVANNVGVQNINKLFSKLGRIIFMVSFLIYSGFLIFGREFIYFWAGDGYDSSYLCAIIPMTALIVPIVQGPGIDIQRAMNKHKARSIAYAFIAAFNLLISIILIVRYNEVGASLGTAIALVLGQWLFMNYYYHKNIGLDIKLFWMEILKMIPGSGCLIIFGFIIKHFVYFNSLITLFVGVVVYVFLYIFMMYFVCMNEYEKATVRNSIISIFGE